MFYKDDVTRLKILKETASLFAFGGPDSISTRKIASKVGISASVLYYYFKNKDQLLRAMFDELNTSLGLERAKLPKTKSASSMMKQRIEFQLAHAEEIVAVLKYFLLYRRQFNKIPSGYVPEKAYLHIEEALRFGADRGEFASREIPEQAKIITHAINGFLLEYYPEIPEDNERQKLVTLIHKFIMRGVLRV